MRRVLAAVTILFASFAIVIAQQQQPPQQQQQQQTPPPAGGQRGQAPQGGQAPAAPAQKPYVPVSASTFAAHPDRYYGEPVSLTGTVEQPLSKTSFSVDQDKTKSTGQDVLIVAPNLNQAVEANTYVTVLGEALKFDPAEIAKKAKDYKLDLPADAATKFQGKPVIIAKSVIVNSTGVDIAMRLPPPMNAEEEAFQKVMKAVGPANTALRGALDKTDVAASKEQATILAKSFVQTEAFWKSRNKPDAVKWATDARTMADAVDKAVAAGKWDDAKQSATTLAQQCGSCHGTYRERFDDGSFRIIKK